MSTVGAAQGGREEPTDCRARALRIELRYAETYRLSRRTPARNAECDETAGATEDMVTGRNP